jgi:hypothetical protein
MTKEEERICDLEYGNVTAAQMIRLFLDAKARYEAGLDKVDEQTEELAKLLKK